MQDGSGRLDIPDIYTNDKAARIAAPTQFNCGGGWQIYLRQSMPGLGNHAFDKDGKQMKNWWPFLFY